MERLSMSLFSLSCSRDWNSYLKKGGKWREVDIILDFFWIEGNVLPPQNSFLLWD